jgi:hypothetical protein
VSDALLHRLMESGYHGAQWRQGRKVGRTVYWQEGEQPSDGDPLIGTMDSPELAALVVEAVNYHLQMMRL